VKKNETFGINKALQQVVVGARIRRIAAEQLWIPDWKDRDVQVDLTSKNAAAVHVITYGLMGRLPLVWKPVTDPNVKSKAKSKSELYTVLSNLETAIWMVRRGVQEVPCLVLAVSSDTLEACGMLELVPELLFGHLSRRKAKKLQAKLSAVSSATFMTHEIDGISALSSQRPGR